MKTGDRSEREPATRLEPVRFSEIAGWQEDDHAAALECFRVSARRMAQKPYTTKELGADAAALGRIGAEALAYPDGDDPRLFFETRFRPVRIVPPGGSGFVTGYYEPEVAASPVRTPRFAYPLYRRPDDLANIDDATRPPGMDPYFMFARRAGDRLEEYPDRSAIESGALAGRGLELAWIEDPVDGFFIHIQGSARLLMPDGDTWRISYDGKTGHRFTAIGAILIERGEMKREEVTADAIRDWLRADAVRARELMRRNRSFIFFRRVLDADPRMGPVAAASTPLTAGRSLAADHRLHTFGSPIFVSTAEPIMERQFRRLMIVQDTGSAIVGPARGDLFIGSGAAAGSIAGGIKHKADFVLLMPQSVGEPR